MSKMWALPPIDWDQLDLENNMNPWDLVKNGLNGSLGGSLPNSNATPPQQIPPPPPGVSGFSLPIPSDYGLVIEEEKVKQREKYNRKYYAPAYVNSTHMSIRDLRTGEVLEFEFKIMESVDKCFTRFCRTYVGTGQDLGHKCEPVNVGFHSIKMVCKICDKDC